jgi:hypothetical protein
MKTTVFALALLMLSACQQPLRSETNDEWFKLVTISMRSESGSSQLTASSSATWSTSWP